MELQALFRFFDQYLPLDEGEKATFRQRANIRRIKRRQFLLQEGALCRYYWFVVEACLKRLPPHPCHGSNRSRGKPVMLCPST